jgi:hypothetical protein
MKANDLLTLKTLTAELGTQKIGQGERLSADDQALIVEMALGAGSAIPPGADVPMPNMPAKPKGTIETAPSEVVLPQQQVANFYENKNEQQEGIIEISGPAPGATGTEESEDSGIPGAPSSVSSGTIAKQQIRIVFTGRSGAGKTFLADAAALQVVEIDSQIFGYLKQTFQNAGEADLSAAAAKIRWWGEGVISNAVPVTVERLLFTQHISANAAGFGEPGYWVKRLVDGLSSGPHIVVTQVETTNDLKALIASGFKHYHVMCSNSTLSQRQKRANADDRLANALDQDVTRKLSQSRQGDRLKCIWCDERAVIPNPQRLYSVADFINAVNAAK